MRDSHPERDVLLPRPRPDRTALAAGHAALAPPVPTVTIWGRAMTDMRQNQRQRRGVAEPDNPPDRRRHQDRRLALVIAVGFAIVGGFQLALVAGAPWGAAAYGGANPGPLPMGLRAASVLAALFWLLAGLTALARGGLASPVPQSFSRRALRVLTGVLAIGFVMNVASSSPWERFGWAPLTLGLTVGSLRLGLAGAVMPLDTGKARATAPSSRRGRPSGAQQADSARPATRPTRHGRTNDEQPQPRPLR